MIKVACICETRPQNEKVDDIFYLDQNTIYGDFEGAWYGRMYKMDENMNYIDCGIKMLKRFKRID